MIARLSLSYSNSLISGALLHSPTPHDLCDLFLSRYLTTAAGWIRRHWLAHDTDRVLHDRATQRMQDIGRGSRPEWMKSTEDARCRKPCRYPLTQLSKCVPRDPTHSMKRSGPRSITIDCGGRSEGFGER